MGIGVSIFLIAVGAVLKWAITTHTDGVSLDTIGVILMIVGVLGLLFSLIVWGPWDTGRRSRVRERVVDDQGYGYDREVRRDDL